VSFGITHIFMDKFLIFDESIFNFLPNLMLFVIFGLINYLLVTYLIDKKTRQLFKKIIKEIRGKNNRIE